MDRWFIVGRCIHCNSPLYELMTPTVSGWKRSWIRTGTWKWDDGGFDCHHELDSEDIPEDEIHTRTDN